MYNLYDRIQELCKKRGVSGSRMCLELGLSKSTLSDIKSGKKKGISTDNAKKIATYLGVSVGYLLGQEKKEAPDQLVLTEGEEAFIKLLRRVPAEDRPIVIEKILSELDNHK